MSGSALETKVMAPVGDGRRPRSAGSADRRWIVLPVLCLSVFLVVVDNTIVNVALPTLNRTLGASITSLQWIVDAYSLAFAGLLLAGGGIGDRLGTQGHHAGRPGLLRPVLGRGGLVRTRPAR